MRRIALITNPASGGRPTAALAARVADVFTRAGCEVDLLPTQRPGHAVDLVEGLLRERAGEALDVAVLGGDGTLNEALFGAQRAAALHEGAAWRLIVLPGGTTNVVASCLGLPRDPVAAAHAAVRGSERALDVGLCRLHAQLRPFILACGAGLDAEVVRAMRAGRKRRLGRLAYFATAWELAGERPCDIAVEIERADGSREVASCATVLVGAADRYAGPLRLLRGSRPDDGLLEVALFETTRLLPALRAGLAALRRDFAHAPRVRVVQVRSVRVASSSEVPVHVDAELAGALPVEISVRPVALRVLAPASP
jgi:diacylglycerol kinase (ATP)